MADINYQQPYEYQYQQPNAPYAQYGAQTPPPPYAYGYPQPQMRQKSVRDEFVAEHRKNGLVERLYNGIKNLTKLGIGSKKVEAVVKKAENGEISEEEARATIQRYRSSQANSAQVVGDAISMAGGITTFLLTKKQLVEEGPQAYLRKKHGIIKNEEKDGTKEMLNFFSKKKKGLKLSESKLAETFKNPKGINLKLALGCLFAASSAKWLFGLINRIGAKEFYVDKKDYNGAVTPYDKSMYNMARKESRRDRRHADYRNMFSGAINGAVIPVMGLVGGIVGVPLYFVINSLNRYFVGNHVDEDKSFKSYMQNIKNNGFLGATLALGAGIPIAIKTHKLSAYDKYSRQAVKMLENATFKRNEFGGKSNYQELSDILLNSKDIRSIIKESEEYGISIEELQTQAKNLVDKNFFAAKMKQISNDGSALSKILKEDSKPTRGYNEAQAYIDNCFGKGEYIIDKDHYCLGVGTVAETYFAKGKDGKEVCIKVIKEGMDANKIKRDADSFKQIIDSATKNGQPLSDAEKKMYKQSIDNLEEGVLKEIDLVNEFNASKDLAKDTQFANIVKGLNVSKDGHAYVMERAKGISLESLMNLNEAYSIRENLVKLANGEASKSFMDAINASIGASEVINGMRNYELQEIIKKCKHSDPKDAIVAIDKYIAKVEAKTPTHGNIKLEPEDIKNLISEYQQVLVEQYSRVSVNGKVVHGDIHPGNIFIDIDALRAMKSPNKAEELWTNITGKVQRKNHGVFTLIDTGNVIKLTKEQSISLLNLQSYIEHGNYQKIAEYVMQGVEGDALGGHTKEEATKLISDQLKACFIDTETPLEIMTTDNLLKLTSNIMKKHGIVPNDIQLNLNKAIQSANNSYDSLVKGLVDGRMANFDLFKTVIGRADGAKDSDFLIQVKKNMEKAQQQENLRNMSVAERHQQEKMEGNLKPNQVEYHIYRLKQGLAKT